MLDSEYLGAFVGFDVVVRKPVILKSLPLNDLGVQGLQVRRSKLGLDGLVIVPMR